MAKYKQKMIPIVNTPATLKGKSGKELRSFVIDHYNAHIRGRIIKNKRTGFDIHFSGAGLKKITHGGALYPNKAIAVLAIDKLLELAEFNNFGQPKSSDPKELTGYLNFKAKCKIDGFVRTFRISALLYRNKGKIYWSHDQPIKKG